MFCSEIPKISIDFCKIKEIFNEPRLFLPSLWISSIKKPLTGDERGFFQLRFHFFVCIERTIWFWQNEYFSYFETSTFSARQWYVCDVYVTNTSVNSPYEMMKHFYAFGVIVHTTQVITINNNNTTTTQKTGERERESKSEKESKPKSTQLSSNHSKLPARDEVRQNERTASQKLVVSNRWAN